MANIKTGLMTQALSDLAKNIAQSVTPAVTEAAKTSKIPSIINMFNPKQNSQSSAAQINQTVPLKKTKKQEEGSGARMLGDSYVEPGTGRPIYSASAEPFNQQLGSEKENDAHAQAIAAMDGKDTLDKEDEVEGSAKSAKGEINLVRPSAFDQSDFQRDALAYLAANDLGSTENDLFKFLGSTSDNREDIWNFVTDQALKGYYEDIQDRAAFDTWYDYGKNNYTLQDYIEGNNSATAAGIMGIDNDEMLDDLWSYYQALTGLNSWRDADGTFDYIGDDLADYYKYSMFADYLKGLDDLGLLNENTLHSSQNTLDDLTWLDMYQFGKAGDQFTTEGIGEYDPAVDTTSVYRYGDPGTAWSPSSLGSNSELPIYVGNNGYAELFNDDDDLAGGSPSGWFAPRSNLSALLAKAGYGRRKANKG